MVSINTDVSIVRALTKLAGDSFTQGVSAGVKCAMDATPCRDHQCCTEIIDWSTHKTDLQAMAAAVDSNDNVKKVCFLDNHQMVEAFSVRLEQDFKVGGLFPIGNMCTPADVAELLQAVTDATCNISPITSDCHTTLSSPSCAGGRGQCTECALMRIPTTCPASVRRARFHLFDQGCLPLTGCTLDSHPLQGARLSCSGQNATRRASTLLGPSIWRTHSDPTAGTLARTSAAMFHSATTAAHPSARRAPRRVQRAISASAPTMPFARSPTAATMACVHASSRPLDHLVTVPPRLSR